jgi:hypothetical protein
MLTAKQSLIWVAREFAITVTLSFGILNMILWMFFQTPTVPKLPPIRLLELVVGCTTMVFSFFACVMGILHFVLPSRDYALLEPETGQMWVEEHKIMGPKKASMTLENLNG